MKSIGIKDREFKGMRREISDRKLSFGEAKAQSDFTKDAACFFMHLSSLSFSLSHSLKKTPTISLFPAGNDLLLSTLA